LPDDGQPADMFATINPTLMEVQMKEAKLEDDNGAVTPVPKI